MAAGSCSEHISDPKETNGKFMNSTPPFWDLSRESWDARSEPLPYIAGSAQQRHKRGDRRPAHKITHTVAVKRTAVVRGRHHVKGTKYVGELFGRPVAPH